MALITKAPRGTHDKLPAEIHKYQEVECCAFATAKRYGYREIRTPVFEHTELFQRSVGDTTDIVQKEMYTFDDKGGRSLTLKPEGTAGAARAAVENGLLGEALPLKLCYVTNCYRYEAPQSGRYREFSQFGAEVYGADTPGCDAELISMAFELFDVLNIHIDSYSVEVNSIGCPTCRGNYQTALSEYYRQYELELCKDCLERITRNPMRLLDCKSPVCGKFKDNAPLILDYNCEDCSTFFEGFKSRLDLLGVPYKVNPKIVRGLDYYTNTVFEFVAKSGLVFGGGGRYNGLVAELGGASVPASGFALGLERLVSVIDDTAGFGECETPDIYIGSMGDAAAKFALKLACELRKFGLWAECDIVGRSVKAQMRYADKIGAQFSMVIGDSELETQSATLKNMRVKDDNRSVDLSQLEHLVDALYGGGDI